MKATIGENGQIVIPEELRKGLGLKPGMQIDFTLERGKLVGRKESTEDPWDNLVGCLGTGVDTDEVMKELRGEP
mgnify:CR=1 FL=1